MSLSDDLAFDFAVDCRLAIELQFTIDLGARAEVSAHIRRQAVWSIDFCHWFPPLIDSL